MKENFLHSLLSGANGRWSSKRVTGCFCFIFVFCAFIYSRASGMYLTSDEVRLLETVLYMGAALLGFGVFEKKFKVNDTSEEGQKLV